MQNPCRFYLLILLQTESKTSSLESILVKTESISAKTESILVKAESIS